MRNVRHASVQLIASCFGAILSMASSSLISHQLSLDARSSNGIYLVLGGNIFLLTQFSMSGALNVVGVYAYYKQGKNRIIELIWKRIMLIFFAICLLTLFYNLQLSYSLLCLCGFSLLSVIQTYTNSFQPHLSQAEYACWRIVQVIFYTFFLFSFVLSNHYQLDLFNALAIWAFSNLIVCVLLHFRFQRIRMTLPINDLLSSDDFKGASKGAIAHIGLHDLLKIEQYLIPAFKDVNFSAYYFAVGGLANWPRILIDGFATSFFQSYRNLDMVTARKISLKKSKIVILGTVAFATITLPVFDYFSSYLLGSRYSEYLWIYYFSTLGITLNSGRRLVLDHLRIAGTREAKFATKLELLSGSFQISSVAFLFLDLSLTQWSAISLIFSMFSLLLLILALQRVGIRLKLH